MNRQAEQVQIRMWLIAAMTALLGLRAPEGGALTNLILGTALVCICVCTTRLCANYAFGKWMCIIQWIWGCVMLLYFLKDAATLWSERGGAAIPISLLLLSLWSQKKGVASMAAVGATLIWFVVSLIGGIGASAVEDINWRWAVTDAAKFSPALISVYLLPALAWMIPAGERKRNVNWYFLLPVIGAALCAVVRGIVPVVPDGRPGIVELSRSVELFGKTLRLEAVTAMALTLGLYCVISLITAGIKACADKIDQNRNWLSGWVTGIAVTAGLLGNIHITDEIATVGSVICWVFLPVITQGIGSRKKS